MLKRFSRGTLLQTLKKIEKPYKFGEIDDRKLKKLEEDNRKSP